MISIKYISAMYLIQTTLCRIQKISIGYEHLVLNTVI